MIEVQNLYKSFGRHQILKGVQLVIPKGKITVIMGPSGCGKTVLMRHIIGLLRPDRGLVRVSGVDLASLDRFQLNDFRRKFGMLFQHAALFDSMSVFENVAFPLREQRKYTEGQIRDKVREKLLLVGLKDVDEKMPAELSGGMRKRVGLARAISLSPEIILYDEPTTGLDPLMTEVIDNLILDMQRGLQVTSVIISHDVVSTFRIADHIAMLSDGKIVEFGTPEEVRQSKQKVVQEFLQLGRKGI